MCGTPSCRGYLEVFEDDQHMRDVTKIRKGLWISSREAQDIAYKGAQGGEWLVHKRIRVWWDGNDAFFEADVVSFDPASGLHKVFYLVDNDISEEKLLACENGLSVANGVNAAVWELLDESREEKAIGLKKKDTSCNEYNSSSQTSFSSSLQVVVSSKDNGRNLTSPTTKFKQHGVRTHTVDKNLIVECSLCSYIAVQFEDCLSRHRYRQVTDNKNPNEILFDKVSEIIKMKYNANSRLCVQSVAFEGLEDDEGLAITIFGATEEVNQALGFLDIQRESLRYLNISQIKGILSL